MSPTLLLSISTLREPHFGLGRGCGRASNTKVEEMKRIQRKREIRIFGFVGYEREGRRQGNVWKLGVLMKKIPLWGVLTEQGVPTAKYIRERKEKKKKTFYPNYPRNVYEIFIYKLLKFVFVWWLVAQGCLEISNSMRKINKNFQTCQNCTVNNLVNWDKSMVNYWIFERVI